MLNKAINYIVEKCYDGNLLAFKSDPIVGTILSTGTIWGIDYHLALTKVVGTGVLSLMSVTIGVMGPMLIRYWLHKYQHKFPFFSKLLTHDKKKDSE